MSALAARAGPRTVRRRSVAEWSGEGAVADSAPWLDELHDQAGLSMLSRRDALQAWVASFPGWDPWILGVLADDGSRALAPLVRRRTKWGIEVVSIGYGAFQESPVTTQGDTGADELAVVLRGALDDLSPRWMLRLPQVPLGSPLVSALARECRVTCAFPGSARPMLRFEEDHPGRRWLTPNTASALSKARNRIRREGHRLDVGWLEHFEPIQDVLPEVLEVHRARDLELRGRTLLDDVPEAGFYDEMVSRHAARWRLLTVRIDDALAGYALCLLDGDTLRVWDNRVAPAWRRYSAGLIANTAVVVRGAEDPGIRVVDWGCGVQRYKASMSNAIVDAHTVVAWSSVVLRAGLACRRRLAAHVRGRTTDQ